MAIQASPGFGLQDQVRRVNLHAGQIRFGLRDALPASTSEQFVLGAQEEEQGSATVLQGLSGVGFHD